MVREDEDEGVVGVVGVDPDREEVEAVEDEVGVEENQKV